MDVRWHKAVIIFSGILLFMALGCERSLAAFSLHPGIYVRLEATDNLYLSEVDRNREMITTIAPNLYLSQDGKLLDLVVDYRYEMYRFLNQPELNDRVDTHLGTLNGMILPERNFTIELFGDARLENVDTRQSDVIDTPTVNTTNRYEGRIRPAYHLDLGSRHFIEAAYAYEIVRYDDPLSDDTHSERVELAFVRRQSSRIDLYANGFYEQFNATINSDFERLQGVVGGEWRPSSTLTLSATGGVSWFEYETGEDFKSNILDCWLRYQPASRWAVDISYVEDFDYGVLDGLFKTWRGEAVLSYDSRLSWRVGLFSREDDYVETTREDREQGVFAESDYQLTERVTFGLQGDVRVLEFLPAYEEVDRYSYGAHLEYAPMDYITTGCRYVYRNSDSNIDTNDYRENRYDCSISLIYPLIR